MWLELFIREVLLGRQLFLREYVRSGHVLHNLYWILALSYLGIDVLIPWIVRNIWLINNNRSCQCKCLWSFNLWHLLLMSLNMIPNVGHGDHSWLFFFLLTFLRVLDRILNGYDILKHFFVTDLWSRHHEVRKQCVLGSSLEGLKWIWLSLNNLHALVDGREYHTLEWRDFEVLIVIYLIQYIKCNDSLRLSEHISLQQITDFAANSEPLRSAEGRVKLLQTLIKSFTTVVLGPRW